MDEELQPAADDHERISEAPQAHDALDQPGVPILGLSVPTVVAVFVGGTLGTLARYLLEVHHPTGGFPWATLAVNLSGSFAIGLVLPLMERLPHRWTLARPLLVVGFLGGWTTYSTLAVEATLLAKDGDAASCLAYLVATVVGGLGLVMAGHTLGRRWAPA